MWFVWWQFPVLAFLLFNKGLPFPRAFCVWIAFNFVLGSFLYVGLLAGIWAIAIAVLSFWVYGNAAENKVRLGWFFAIVTFLMPILGFPLYLLLRNNLAIKEKIDQTIVADDGKIEIYAQK